VAADEAPRLPAASATKLRLRWLVIVVAVIALLTAGWPLLDMAVSDGHPLARGSRLIVGTEPGSSAVVTVGAGWTQLQAESDPMQGYLLQRNGVELSIARVALLGRSQVPHLWAGLRQILSLRHPGVRLTKPALITGAGGLRAITGGVATPDLIGTATIVPGRSGAFGIVMVLLAPRGTGLAMRIAAIQVMSSLRFTMAGR
jgi:hypothetical protein